jgi:chromosome segregation ATPase
MKPAQPETADMLNRVRQQLILAQVRIMEIEDFRDELSGKLEETEKLLTAAQQLSDQKVEDASHLAKVRIELQAQFEHMRHMQHVTNEALNLTRAQLESTEGQRSQLQQEVAGLREQAARLNDSIEQLKVGLIESKTTAEVRSVKINQLETEIETLRATRSWRWTGWLRSLGR